MALIRQRKLSKQQIRRIEKQQQAHQDDNTNDLIDGVVIAHYGKQLEVQVTSLPAEQLQKPSVADGEPEPFGNPLNCMIFGGVTPAPTYPCLPQVITYAGLPTPIQVWDALNRYSPAVR